MARTTKNAATYYNRKEEILWTKMETIIQNNLEFTGTFFIRFDSQADAKAAKIAIQKISNAIVLETRNSAAGRRRSRLPAVSVERPIRSARLRHRLDPFEKAATCLEDVGALALTYWIYVLLMSAPPRKG
jgi:serine kinase of HPr protein (carbohydrate metabolism regulator)